jgi:hypothetical protein
VPESASVHPASTVSEPRHSWLRRLFRR